MNQLFKICRLDVAEAEKISAQLDEPHQHDYETLIIGMHGSLEHFIDFKTRIIKSPLVSFVAKCKVHQVIPHDSKGKFDMWLINFKSEFIAETIFQLYTIYHDNANLELRKGSCFNRLNTICEILYSEMKQVTPDLSIVRHLLSALFIMIESERKKVENNEETLGGIQNETFKNFLKILEENFRRPMGVEFYAEKLFMSSRNLNLICQSIMNQSVSEIIDSRKLIEAKNLLAGTNKTISQIGFELGYNEKSYFSNVFKRKSGQTPTEFREEMR